jgi:hypothetical protein
MSFLAPQTAQPLARFDLRKQLEGDELANMRLLAPTPLKTFIRPLIAMAPNPPACVQNDPSAL